MKFIEARKVIPADPRERRPRGRMATTGNLKSFERRHLRTAAEYASAFLILGGLSFALKNIELALTLVASIPFGLSWVHAIKGLNTEKDLQDRYTMKRKLVSLPGRRTW